MVNCSHVFIFIHVFSQGYSVLLSPPYNLTEKLVIYQVEIIYISVLERNPPTTAFNSFFQQGIEHGCIRRCFHVSLSELMSLQELLL